MGEIISIGLGGGGVNAALKFWENVMLDHRINENGEFKGNDTQRICLNTYFTEKENKTLVPRSILLDLEPEIKDIIRMNRFHKTFDKNFIIVGKNGIANNFAKGIFTEGREIFEECGEKIHELVETCDYIQAFDTIHSLGGGTGAGTGLLETAFIAEQFPDRIHTSYSIIPSGKVTSTVIEPYNAVLSLQYLINFVDQTIFLDNQALHELSFKMLKIPAPKYKDYNVMIGELMKGLTKPFRFPNSVQYTPLKQNTLLVPYQGVQFLIPSCDPLLPNINKTKMNLITLNDTLLKGTKCLCSCDYREGKHMTMINFLHGDVSLGEVARETLRIKRTYEDNFLNYIPDSFRIISSKCFRHEDLLCGCSLSNTTAVLDIFKRLYDAFDDLYKKKAFLHWYTEEGMEEMEFNNAFESLQIMMDAYKECLDQDLNLSELSEYDDTCCVDSHLCYEICMGCSEPNISDEHFGFADGLFSCTDCSSSYTFI